MSVTGFLVDGQIQKYDYNSLDNLPDIPESSGTFWATYNSTSEAEITDAFSNNKSVMMKYGNDVFLVTRKLGIGPSGSAWLFTSVGQTDIRTTWVSGSYWNTFSTNAMGGDISNNLKQALLQLASKVAYVDEYGQTYYNDLYNALYPKELISISATFNQGSNIIYDIDPLTVLNQYLTVVANYSDGTTETIPSSDYTLSGNLLEGVSTITVYYEGFTDTFNVNVTHMAGYYTIVNNLTGCTTNNPATAIQENISYTAIITASAGYTLSGATATITMGGNILTGVFSNGTISIPNVTGDLVITVVASTITLSSISAVYTQSGTVYDTDTLDSLKADLVITAHYSDSSTQVVSAEGYTLSGTLAAGTSTITVNYGGKTATFNVTVTSLSYVSDGLVMWLDGEKNSENGAHASNLTTWVDQSGNGWDFDNVGATVNAKSLSFNGKSQYLKRAYDSLPHDVKMMEAVTKHTSGYIVISGFGNNYIGNIIYANSGSPITFQTGTGSGNDKNSGLSIPEGIRSTVFSANSAGYVNGEAVSVSTNTNAWQYRYPCIGAYLGSGGNNFQYGFRGEIYCIRMYNRILTEQEILANYAVDAHRFGIGG